MELAKYLGVIITSMFKFLIGPVLGYKLKLSIIESFLMTNLGLMVSVIIFVSLGEQLKKRLFDRYLRKKVFSPRNRRLVQIWTKYGLGGIAFLTPILLSPPVGTLVATSFGESRKKILVYMLISGLFWGLVVVIAVYFFGNQIKQWLQ